MQAVQVVHLRQRSRAFCLTTRIADACCTKTNPLLGRANALHVKVTLGLLYYIYFISCLSGRKKCCKRDRSTLLVPELGAQANARFVLARCRHPQSPPLNSLAKPGEPEIATLGSSRLLS